MAEFLEFTVRSHFLEVGITFRLSHILCGGVVFIPNNLPATGVLKFSMLAGGAVVFVRTSAICRSELTHRVRIPVARICCLVAVTSIEVRFSERPNPRDSLFSMASYRLLQSVIAQDSGRSLRTSSGRRRSIPSEWRQSAKKRRTKFSMST